MKEGLPAGLRVVRHTLTKLRQFRRDGQSLNYQRTPQRTPIAHRIPVMLWRFCFECIFSLHPIIEDKLVVAAALWFIWAQHVKVKLSHLLARATIEYDGV